MPRQTILGRFSLSVVTAGVLAGCGGDSPTAPTPTTSVPPTPGSTPQPVFSLGGAVVTTVSRQPVAGATVAVEGISAQTDSAGHFRIEFLDRNPEFTPFAVTVSAQGFLTRNAHVRWQPQERTGVTIDIIEDRSPFDLDFYRQIARDAFDEPTNLQPLRRWPGPDAPKFYIKMSDETGRRVIGDTDVRTIRNTILQTVPEITDGLFRPTVIESGLDDRPERAGWIRILMVRDSSEFCGRSSVGGDPGTIELVRTGCGCVAGEKVNSALVAHELGHAMGFFHISEFGVMDRRRDFCRIGNKFSAKEIFHTRITYRRPRLNTDPDVDPTTGALRLSPSIGPPVVSCFVPHGGVSFPVK